MAEESGWRPIETAPRDGSCVDVWVPEAGQGYRVADARWQQPISRWTTHVELGIWGWYALDGKRLTGPTHWRPLPEPPHG
jgi:hypothetical protein